MEYQTVFNISTAGYKSGLFVIFGLIFVAASFLILVIRKNPSFLRHLEFFNKLKLRNPIYYNNSKFVKIFIWFFITFSILWTVTMFLSTFLEYGTLISAYNHGQYKIAEGKVTDFVPMPYEGHANEKFCVDNDPCFEYSDFEITGGFNNAKSHGGPISEGLNVRVSYVRNIIIKLEVEK